MKKIIKNSIATVMAVALVMGTSLPVYASNDPSIILGNEENAVTFSEGTYDLDVCLKKYIGDDTDYHFTDSEDSMAVDALNKEATLVIDESGNAKVTVFFEIATIMGFKGGAQGIEVYNEHNTTSEKTEVTIDTTQELTIGTFSSKTYNIPHQISFDMPFDKENGVFVDFEILTSLMNMDQTAFIAMDFSSYRADYTSINGFMELAEARKSYYSNSDWEKYEAYIETMSFSQPATNQAVVDTYLSELVELVWGFEEVKYDADAQITAYIAVNEASYIMTIPEEIPMGELSIEEDTAVEYTVDIEIIAGNVLEDFVIQVSSDEFGELLDESNSIRYKNTFLTQDYTETESKTAYFIIEAANAAKAEAGDYLGEVEFSVEKVNQ